jgi:hypothetical protein
MDIHPTHQCFDDAVEIIGREIREDAAQWQTLFVVHGICTMPDGLVYAHAWVERNDTCVFQGLGHGTLPVIVEAEKESFYEYFKVKDFTRYTIDQVLCLGLTLGNTGPWESKYRKLCSPPGQAKNVQKPVRPT